MSKSTIWSRLKAKGLTDTACAAVMGNIQQESAFRSNNVEDRSGIPDETYTRMVDDGSYGDSKFVHDAYGYGLCQWTYWSRKQGLLNTAKQRHVSIADEQMQIDWLWEELGQPPYVSVKNCLLSGASLYDMTAKFMRTFENPADQSDGAINYRVSCAKAILDEFSGTTPEPTPGPDPKEPDTPTTPYWEPRMLCEGMLGADVSVLQALLQAHGYQVEITGIYDNRTKAMVMAFQGENGLATDGIAGPKTFRALGVNV
ncbi:MAG: peptidoglycan-binding protein [Oscillospiraceae bacterium]|nr:peptidoglycan-binding protein [Oscillospiraceae bacterium]